MNALQLLLICLAGWINRNQQLIIEYLQEAVVISKVVHVHAKDISRRQADAERGRVTGTAVGCACGDGEIDWHRIVRRLKQGGYQGVLSVECGTEDEAKRSLAHLTKVLQDENA